MSRVPVIIHHDHLEFIFDYKEHVILLRDHMYLREYQLIPSGDAHLPLTITLERYFSNKGEEK